MGISLGDRLYLMHHHVPVSEIRKALAVVERNGLSVTLRELAGHHLIGGDIEALVNGLLFAREHSIPLNRHEAVAIDLAKLSTGKPLAAVLTACVEPRIYTFDTFSPEDSEPLAGFTRDGTRVEATCTLTYRLTPQHVFGWTIERQHERLAVRIAVLINKAPDPHLLEMARPQHEQTLLSLGADAGVQDVSLKYQRA